MYLISDEQSVSENLLSLPVSSTLVEFSRFMEKITEAEISIPTIENDIIFRLWRMFSRAPNKE